MNPRQGSSSTQSLDGFNQGPGEHHQHQLENLFEFTLPTPGPSTPRRASSASAGKSFCVHSPNARPINPRQGSSSTQSLDGFSEGPGEHHQHQLENLFEISLPTPGPSTRGKVPVQPNHWTDLAKDPASIISISWKTFLFLSSLSQHRALQPPGEHH